MHEAQVAIDTADYDVSYRECESETGGETKRGLGNKIEVSLYLVKDFE